jgi:hypothetical protein
MKGAPFAPPNDSSYICYTPIAEGAVNLEAFLARLRRDKYSSFCVLEPHVKGDRLMEAHA